MQKKLIITFIAFIGFVTLQAQGFRNIEQIEFSTTSRNGDYKELLVSNKTAHVNWGNKRNKDNNIHIERKTHKKECRRLNKALKRIEIESIPTLKSPTNKRAFDGANHSIIVIKTKGNKVLKHRFDDLNPHADLSILLKIILKFFPKKD